MTMAAAGGQASSLFATPKTIAEHRADGSIVLRSPEPLREAARCIGDWLEQWARQTPDRIFLAERGKADAPWITVTYAQALAGALAGVVDPRGRPEHRASARHPLRQ
jgi:feruloyl-CoA synthase